MPDRAWRKWLAAHSPVKTVDVRQTGPDSLVVSLRGPLDEKSAERAGRALAHLLDAGPHQAHIDLTRAGDLGPSLTGAVFVPLAVAARARAVAVTVHHAAPRTRASLRALGLDRVLAHSDDTP